MREHPRIRLFRLRKRELAMHFRIATGTPDMRLAPLQNIWVKRFIRLKSLRNLSNAVHFQSEAESDRRWIWWCGILSEPGTCSQTVWVEPADAPAKWRLPQEPAVAAATLFSCHLVDWFRIALPLAGHRGRLLRFFLPVAIKSRSSPKLTGARVFPIGFGYERIRREASGVGAARVHDGSGAGQAGGSAGPADRLADSGGAARGLLRLQP